MKKLIIIGNGFDLGHNLQTSFQNFIDSNPEYSKKYELFHGDNWNCIEQNYADNLISIMQQRDYVDIADELEIAINDIGFNKYGDLVYDQIDSDRYTGELDDIYKNIELLTKLENDFENYLIENYDDNKLKQVKPRKQVAEILDNSYCVINFNYTSVIEMVYNMNNVIHIHGSINENNIAIGTGTLDSIKDSMIDNIYPTEIPCRDKYDLQEQMFYYEEDMDGNLVEKENIRRLFNEIQDAIEENEQKLFNLIDKKCKDTLSSREKIKEMLEIEKFDVVFILGHSLSEADLPVFEKINKDAKVICYYFKNEEYEYMNDIFDNLGVKPELMLNGKLYDSN